MGRASTNYPAELRERAVLMVAEVRAEYVSEWAAIVAVAKRLGIGSAETLRKWVRQAGIDEPLHRMRAAITDVLGKPPAVLAFHRGQQPAYVGARGTPWLWPHEQRSQRGPASTLNRFSQPATSTLVTATTTSPAES